MLRLFSLALFATFLFFAVARSASADPIILTSGFVYGDLRVLADHPYTINASGEGFSLLQHSDEGYFAGTSATQFTPGQTVTANAKVFVTDIFGFWEATVMYNGVLYTHLRAQGLLTVEPVTFIVPPYNSLITTAPFSLSGPISFATLDHVPLFTVDVVGSGLATFRFRGIGAPETVDLSEVRYDFGPAAPVPEPGSLILLSSGLMGWVIPKLFQKKCRIT